jgi:hypothetical protein
MKSVGSSAPKANAGAARHSNVAINRAGLFLFARIDAPIIAGVPVGIDIE